MLRYTLISIAPFLLTAVEPAPAQVDTLDLVPVGHISVTDQFFANFAEDVYADSVKETIVRTIDHAYVYNSLTGQLIWTSPSLSYAYPMANQISFHDMNADGTCDLAVRDTFGIYIFDIQHSQRLWTSPHFGPANLCFTMGDRNSDGHEDFLVARKIFDTSSGFDTISIEYYDGPGFTLGGRHFFAVESHSQIWSLDEVVNRILLADLSGLQGLTRRLFIFSESSISMYWFDGYDYWSQYIISGAVRIVDPVTFDISIADTYGTARSHSLDNDDSAYISLNVILKREEAFLRNYMPWSLTDDERTVRFSAQGVIESQYIWYYDERLEHYFTGEVMNTNPGDEFLYITGDSLTLVSYPNLDTLWIYETNRDLQHPVGILNLASLYAGPRLLFREPLTVFDGANGHLRAVFSQPDVLIHQIIDFNNDGDDEAISITAQGIDIYRIAGPVSVGDRDNQPFQFSLAPNYPNPFNAATTISFSLPHDAPASLFIYNILGEKVATLLDKPMTAGTHSVTWHADALPSGVYFARLRAGTQSKAMPMTLIK